MAERPAHPLAVIIAGDGQDEVDTSEDEDEDEDEGVVVACHWDGHAFALNGDQPLVEMVVDIAAQLQDNVIEEVWGAWPACPSDATGSEAASPLAPHTCHPSCRACSPLDPVSSRRHPH